MNDRTIFEWILRIGLGAVFIYAGAAKLPDIQEFFWDIYHFELTPWDVSVAAAYILPWLEIVAGLSLIVGRLYLGGVTICTSLSALFLGAISSAWYRGLDITCGCFGREDNATNFPKHVTINTVMLLTSLTLWWLAAIRSKETRQAIDQGTR